jgi:hypothetical protein
MHRSVRKPVRARLARSLISDTAREMPAAAGGGYPRWSRVTARSGRAFWKTGAATEKTRMGLPCEFLAAAKAEISITLAERSAPCRLAQ